METQPSTPAKRPGNRARLHWTDAAPHSTGFYWYSTEFGSEVVLCEIRLVDGTLRGQLEDGERWHTLGDLAGWWMGPIGKLV